MITAIKLVIGKKYFMVVYIKCLLPCSPPSGKEAHHFEKKHPSSIDKGSPSSRNHYKKITNVLLKSMFH